jgi:hypothetical protein
MKKPIVITIIVLVFVVGIFAYLNKQSIGDKIQDQKNSILSIKHDGKEEKIDMTFIKSLGEENFEANLKKSGKAPVKHEYTGVDLKKIIEAKKISLSGKSTLTATAVDGYSSAINIDEIEKGSNVYIVYKIDGDLLKSNEEGGDGPFMMLIRGDQFSQRWCKLLVGVELN